MSNLNCTDTLWLNVIFEKHLPPEPEIIELRGPVSVFRWAVWNPEMDDFRVRRVGFFIDVPDYEEHGTGVYLFLK